MDRFQGIKANEVPHTWRRYKTRANAQALWRSFLLS
jgi:hypothetical protein